ncbi:DsrE family protein [Methanocaldococcus indicus]|uniref:DsrE family protein n=1 Tax=Methanocaldococcus indicus TaxID=213231 RepID=UPI003C6D2201
MIKFSVKGLRNPEILLDLVLRMNKDEDLIIVEADNENIDKLKEYLEKNNLNYDIDGNTVKIFAKEIKANKTVNVVGATCPGPIMIVSDMLEKMKVGEILEIVCGENAITDLTEGLKGAGHEILKVEKEGDTYKIYIRKGEKKKEEIKSIDIDELFIINTTGTGNAERAYSTFMMADIALKMGLKPTIFLMLDGASLALKGECDKVKHPAFPKLGDLVRDVIKKGVKVYVCELSAEFRGINKNNLEDGFIIAGAPTFLNYLRKPNVRPVWL